MLAVLTIVKPSEVEKAHPYDPKTGKDPLSRFDVVSVKSAYMTPSFARRIRKAGAKVALWEWMGARTREQAKAWAVKQGKLCRKYKASHFFVNAESEWAGTGRFLRSYATPYDVLRCVIQTLRIYAPTSTRMAYNGYSWGRTSRKTGSRILHDDALIALFDIWCPQCHGKQETVAARFRKVHKYAHIPTLENWAMIGVGRTDKAGRQYGVWTGTYGYAKLLDTYPLSGVCFYFGNGAYARLLGSRASYPPLVECADIVVNMA